MTNQNIIINKNDNFISAIGKFNSAHTKAVIRKEDGKVYSSVIDAATDVGAIPQNMTAHLRHPEKRKHIKGFHYAYLSDMLSSPNEMFIQLRNISAEKEQYKADARKWREYQAEQERLRKEEEARLEAERKAKAEFEAEKQKLEAKIMRCANVCERLAGAWDEAVKRQMEVEREYEALTGHPFFPEETEVA